MLHKIKDQGQFWNSHDKQIPKLTLIFEFDEEFTEIFMVKGKSQFPKIKRTFPRIWICLYKEFLAYIKGLSSKFILLFLVEYLEFLSYIKVLTSKFILLFMVEYLSYLTKKY